MKSIEIDIETYSDVDLSKCGVYRYSSSPNFEILLFGYSVDGGEVRVVDLCQGENIPVEILAAISDESVTKWAFNAMFERVCLSNYLGEWLEPESWKCSMVWSATLGLPLSLENVGAVLGLEKQKLSEGKDLIRYFCVPCKPTKANGGRTRNLPEHDREKWGRFKAYNLRDVEAEMQIQQRLSKFPVPDFVWEEYWQDQEINDRGIGVDMEMVAQAIAMDGRSKSELSAAMQKLTELEKLRKEHILRPVCVLPQCFEDAVRAVIGDRQQPFDVRPLSYIRPHGGALCGSWKSIHGVTAWTSTWKKGTIILRRRSQPPCSEIFTIR